MKSNRPITAGFRWLIPALYMGILSSPILNAQTISPGTNMTVNNGTVMNSENPMSVTSGGTLDVQGTLILKSNLVNQNSTTTNLGTGVIELSGTTAQSISGQNIIGKLRINNSAGVTLSGDMQVNDSLKIINGLVTLGGSNLTLGSTALCSAGSSTAMVVATGTGEFRKQFPTSPSFPLNFTYPVGDADGTTEYSPVAVSFTSGTFGSGNYLGVNLKNQADPNPDIASGNYLNRYWTFNNNAISGTISCGLTLTFLPADVVGTQSALYFVRSTSPIETFNVTGSNQLTGTVSSFSRFTGSDPALQANFKAFLQGPYSSTNHNMGNSLATTLPLGDRSDLTKFPQNQPYNGSPWSYTGTESVVSLPANVVDWVLVELRQASTPANATAATVVAKRAGFIKQDGTIVDIDGTPLKFYHASITSNLYPVIRHRNHFAIMANNPVTKTAGTYTYDFTTASTQAYQGSFGMKQVDTSPVAWAALGADANADNNIWNNDYSDYYQLTYFVSNQYIPADFNLDGNVWNNDYSDFYQINFFISAQLP